MRWLREVALTWERDDCLLYPFGIGGDGYGITTVNGKSMKAHRFVCIEAHGPSPAPTYQVAHSCGRQTCMNPRHLRWATASENQLDRIGHDTHIRGTRHPDNKLTEAQVLAIRAAPGRYDDLAGRYGVSRGMIGHIKKRRAWKWL